MNPDDNFSPPLDGLSRGKKLHQILTTLADADNIRDHHYADNDRGEGGIVGIVNMLEIIDVDEPPRALGIIICNWWHMALESDWWSYEYLEMDPEEVAEMIEQAQDDEEEEPDPVISEYSCGWYRQANEKVEGQTYFQETHEGESEVRVFDPQFAAPKPLTRAIIDSYLPENIRSRHSGNS